MGRGVRKRDSDNFFTKKFWKIFAVIFLFLIALILIPLLIVSSALSGASNSDSANVALISIEGAILGTSSSSLTQSASLTSKDYITFIKAANEDKNIKAIVLEINSPGGSAVASDELASEILKLEKPTVAVIREMGTSGAYWVASSTDHIISNRMSITGSIGVISSYLEFSDLMEDYGVSYERLVAGEKKDIGTPFKKLTDDEKELFQSKLDTIHQYFIQAISENRGLTQKQVTELSTGEFYLGIEALDLGLVDELGDINHAKEYLESTLKLAEDEEIIFQTYRKESTFLDLLTSISNENSFNIGLGVGSALDIDLKQGSQQSSLIQLLN